MSCTVLRESDFGLSGYDSLSDQLIIKPDGGAVAVWAPTSLSFNDLSHVLNSGFFKAAFTEKEKVPGDAILKAFETYKAFQGPTYEMDIFSLQGDPALRIRNNSLSCQFSGRGLASQSCW